MSLKALLDACTLFGMPLRDTLLRAATEHLYQPRFTESILEEVRRNLVKQGRPPDKMDYMVATISREFDDAFVYPKASLVRSMKNDQKDRHVLAAAVAAKADVIVTFNLRHFPNKLLAHYEIEAVSPDDFLVDLFYADRERMATALSKQASFLSRPAMTVQEILEKLKRQAPTFAELMSKAYAENYEQLWCNAFTVQSDVK
ncbi:MAG: PIN domain-containing protein [Ktedonobacteraceae bacterium]